MAVHTPSKFALFDMARVTGGKISLTHCNYYSELDSSPCNFATAEFRVVGSRPAKKARVTR
jgi:hypothetical protein